MDDTTGESYVENAAGAAVTATGFARATAAVVLAILLAVAPVAGVVEMPAARAAGGGADGVADGAPSAVEPSPSGTADATSVTVTHSNQFTILRTDGEFARTPAISVSGIGDTLDDRYSFRIENADTGASVNVTGDSDTFSARERASYVVTVYRDVAVLLAET
jgi:hypothetical protein